MIFCIKFGSLKLLLSLKIYKHTTLNFTAQFELTFIRFGNEYEKKKEIAILMEIIFSLNICLKKI